MQANGTTQNQQKRREDNPPKRQKAATTEKHVHFGGVFECGNLASDGKCVRVRSQKPPSTAKTFLEGYTDSPEFSRFANPVVDNSQNTNDDDQEYIAPPKFANYQSPMDRPKADPLEYRRLASFGAHLQAQANLVESHNGARLPVQPAFTASHASMALNGEDPMDEDDEPEDDTFEFLFK